MSRSTATGRVLGVHEDAAPAVTAATYPGARWGGGFISRKGGGPLPETTTARQLATAVFAKAGAFLAAGGGCLVRIKLDPVAVARGGWDERLMAVGVAVAGLNIILIICHEPEDDHKPSVFVPGFNRARDAIKGGWPAAEVAYAGMSWQWRPGSKTTADPAAWARDLRADRYLLDVYFGDSFPQSLTLANHPGRVRWHEHMIAPYGRAWGLAEWGRADDPARAAGFAADFEWLATDPVGRTCSLVGVWNTPGTENNPGWLLNDDAKRAVAAGFARLAVPAGYRLGPLPGVLISERTGALVAADLAGVHDQMHGAGG